MPRFTALATVRVVVDTENGIDPEEACNTIAEHMHYAMQFNDEGVRIADTELMEVEPID